jgi:hypothetical protein
LGSCLLFPFDIIYVLSSLSNLPSSTAQSVFLL